MEWLKKILEGAVITEGVLSVDSTVDAIKKEVPKHLIPKDVYNDLKGKYDTANNDLIELRKVDVTALQDELANEKTARAKDKQDFIVTNALVKAGATDVDYLKFKLGDSVKITDDGKIENEEEFIKITKEAYKTMFGEVKVSSATPAGGKGADGEVTKEQFEKMGYTERVNLFNTNKELYTELTGGNE